MKLSGKHAVVTGGATGIGWAIARALAEVGCSVVIGGRREDKLQAAAESFASDPPIRYHQLDVADRQSVHRFFDWVADSVGQVDFLINSAGTNIKNRSMAAMRPDDWDRILAINATGAYNTMHAVLPQMRDRQDGLIINISSIAGKRAAALGGVAYAASKFAMTALGTAVNNEDNQHGIRVTNVFPGEVNTPILEQRPAPVSEQRKQAMLQPEDFGEIAVAICSLPSRANVSDIVLKPTVQEYV